MDDLKLHIILALAMVVLALPFVICGSSAMLNTDESPRDNAYEYFYVMFGLPLTLIVPLAVSGLGIGLPPRWWNVLVFGFSFVLQWVIWGQLLALGIRILGLLPRRDT